jgi:hypothetical protein
MVTERVERPSPEEERSDLVERDEERAQEQRLARQRVVDHPRHDERRRRY